MVYDRVDHYYKQLYIAHDTAVNYIALEHYIFH